MKPHDINNGDAFEEGLEIAVHELSVFTCHACDYEWEVLNFMWREDVTCPSCNRVYAIPAEEL